MCYTLLVCLHLALLLRFLQAANTAHSLFCTCHKFNLQIEKASVLLLLAEIHKVWYGYKNLVAFELAVVTCHYFNSVLAFWPPLPFGPPSYDSQMAGNAVMGLPYALASISFCQSFNLDLLKASATLTLAELWRGLGSNHSKRALDLLHGAFPMILGHGGLELRARAYIFEANCYLSDPSFSGIFLLLSCTALTIVHAWLHDYNIYMKGDEQRKQQSNLFCVLLD